MANELMATYKAGDGTDVELTPQTVAQYMLIGEQQVDQREMASIIAKCRARKLNPLAGDCYITVFKGKASIIISRDYMNVTANSIPTYQGMRGGVITQNKQTGAVDYKSGEFYMAATEEVVGAWAEVYDSRYTQPMHCEIARSEYDQHRNLWNTKPGTMCLKVAEMHAQRKVYPDRFGGVYDAAEMPEEDRGPIPAQATVSDPRPQRPQISDGRKAWLAEYAARLSGVTSIPLDAVKRALMCDGIATMGDEELGRHCQKVAQALMGRQAAPVSPEQEYDAPLDGDDYVVDGAGALGEEYLGGVA